MFIHAIYNNNSQKLTKQTKQTKALSIKKIPFLKGEVVLLNIDSLAAGGAGVSRHKGFVVFTNFTCPGDSVLAKITNIKKNFAQAEIVSIKNPSDKRIVAKCPVFQKCGGCTWQHILYTEQLKQKKQILSSSLGKKISFKDEIIKDVIPSPKEWRYRNRIQLKIDKNFDYGFYEKKSHNIIKIKDCPIADSLLFKDLDKNIKNHTSLKKNYHNQVEVYISREKEIKYIISGNKQNKTNKPDKQNNKNKIDKKAFAQVNEWVNQILIKDILKYLKKHLLPKQTVYDLYCGHGNFSFPINKILNPYKTIGVELNLSSVQIAKKNALQNNIAGLDFIAKDVKSFLQQCKNINGPVILDPPRIGCDKAVIESLIKLKPPVILYISCNPQTLARDLEILIGDNNLYEPVLAQAYDMFPQTDHVESLIVLKLSPKDID